MKKLILSAFVSMGLCFGASIDASKIEMYWAGYKFANKTAVKGTFKDISYKLKKNQGSIKDMLEGATATIALSNLHTGNPTSEKNLTQGFFSNFASPEIKVKITQVMEGDNQGTLLAKVTMNKTSQSIPMQYTIMDGKIQAKGVLDILNFKLNKALEGLIQTCGQLHKGYTWTQVEIGFSAPIQ
ncbi:polyisoprenoid-binding protein [Helicobacter cholecystus]|uniref:Polyisoprenoid-binding protein n=1 Tax=Helicobacter cholecystus TaxID=45498 RepID=A0A3D8IXW9_9HELI|nr:YceI family protein [Helicobacter cholecystus]RDU70117.1 polyisoprenoid-binding protein [Helicobacter cholecystus]VEJ24705.1 yceI-like domain protein [Helicobacter cholecystus]